jgi:hypothetical protein
MGKASMAAMGNKTGLIIEKEKEKEANIVSGTGVPEGGSALTGGDSSQMML